MTIGNSLIVVVVGLLIAAFLSATIGMIIAAIGLIGLVVSLVNGDRARRTL